MDAAIADVQFFWAQGAREGENQLRQLLIRYKEDIALWEAKYEELKLTVNTLQTENAELRMRVAEAERAMVRLEEETREFKSVSRIVAISNDNKKLKETIQILERSLGIRRDKMPAVPTPIPASIPEVASTPVPVSEEVPVPVPVSAPVSEVASEPEEVAPVAEPDTLYEAQETPETYYEVQIKGVTYYMNDAEEVFSITEEGEVGDAVGYYTTVKGKKKFMRYSASA